MRKRRKVGEKENNCSKRRKAVNEVTKGER